MRPAQLRASTLVEIMVVMILTGLVIGSLMEGVDIIRRLTAKVADELGGDSELIDTYTRLDRLVISCDSINEKMQLFRQGVVYGSITQSDSAIVVTVLGQADTLPLKVHSIKLFCGDVADSILIDFGTLKLLLETAKRPEAITENQTEKLEIKYLY